MEREVGGGIGMGNTCKSMADSFQCLKKPTTIKKKKNTKDCFHKKKKKIEEEEDYLREREAGGEKC